MDPFGSYLAHPTRPDEDDARRASSPSSSSFRSCSPNSQQPYYLHQQQQRRQQQQQQQQLHQMHLQQHSEGHRQRSSLSVQSSLPSPSAPLSPSTLTSTSTARPSFSSTRSAEEYNPPSPSSSQYHTHPDYHPQNHAPQSNHHQQQQQHTDYASNLKTGRQSPSNVPLAKSQRYDHSPSGRPSPSPSPSLTSYRLEQQQQQQSHQQNHQQQQQQQQFMYHYHHQQQPVFNIQTSSPPPPLPSTGGSASFFDSSLSAPRSLMTVQTRSSTSPTPGSHSRISSADVLPIRASTSNVPSRHQPTFSSRDPYFDHFSGGGDGGRTGRDGHRNKHRDDNDDEEGNESDDGLAYLGSGSRKVESVEEMSTNGSSLLSSSYPGQTFIGLDEDYDRDEHGVKKNGRPAGQPSMYHQRSSSHQVYSQNSNEGSKPPRRVGAGAGGPPGESMSSSSSSNLSQLPPLFSNSISRSDTPLSNPSDIPSGPQPAQSPSATPCSPPSFHRSISQQSRTTISHSHGGGGAQSSNSQWTSYKLGPVDSSSALSYTSSGNTHSGSTVPIKESRSGQNTPGAQPTPCGNCGQSVTGPFVRALNMVYHLDCFRCQDCKVVVAAKFFPVEAKDGKQYPLCETDYFRRLDLICNTCGTALRGSYITACQKKFHVEHFTCSVCPTVFGSQDSYYEYDGNVYCHFHYSTRFATKCVGCGVAILKQFVEVNRNQKDECWHPECYMIQKFWNVKLQSRFADTPSSFSSSDRDESETAESLKVKQQEMEHQVNRVWTVLSAFEESSAACISEMLTRVSNCLYMEAVAMAEMFIFHVEVLFASIDELERHFLTADAKGMSHVREAKLLCRTTVNFFSLLAHTHETESWRATGITDDLLALVTRLAHYLKILIRIALTGALKLEREYANRAALVGFLDRLARLAHDGGDPAARRRRLLKRRNSEKKPTAQDAGTTNDQTGTYSVSTDPPGPAQIDKYNYGYSSLFVFDGGESLIRADPGVGDVPLDLCVMCRKPVEEDCVRLGIFPHWHGSCIKCSTCGKVAALPPVKESKVDKDGNTSSSVVKSSSSVYRPPPDLSAFVFSSTKPLAKSSPLFLPDKIFCVDHGDQSCLRGFEAVTRLEQFAFLLNAALRRLFLYLRSKGVAPLSPSAIKFSTSQGPRRTSLGTTEAHLDSDVKLVKSGSLDRKISSTAAMVPKRSKVVESPAGKVAKSNVPIPPISTTSSKASNNNSLIEGLPAPSTPYSPSVDVQAPRPTRSQISTAHLDSQPTSRSSSRPLNQQRDLSPGFSNSREGSRASSSLSVIRPSFARNNTSVRIINEPSPDLGQATYPYPSAVEETLQKFDDHLTLGDVSQLVEAEHARVEQRPVYQSDQKLVAELSPVKALIIKYFALLQIQKSALNEVLVLDDVLELMSKKNTFWNKLFKGGKKKEEVKKTGVFGVPLDQLAERVGSDSVLGATSAHLKVPSIVEDTIAAMKQMDMSVEGIFRKNGNIRRLNEITEALDRDPTSVNFADENPVQLAALLKKFLRQLPEPLLTYRLQRLFCQSQSLSTDAERKRYLHLIVCLLPRYNRDTMEILFVFLKWVASFSHVDEETGSKMDLHNLATVITPSILYSKGGNPLKDESFVAIRAVTTLLQMQDEFYTVPDELDRYLDDNLVDFFEKNLELPPKEMLKICSKIHVQIQEHRRQASRPPPLPPKTESTLPGTRLASYQSDTNLSEMANTLSSQPVPSVFTGVEGRQSPAESIQPRPTSWASPGQDHASLLRLGSNHQSGSQQSYASQHTQSIDPPPSPRRATGNASPMSSSASGDDGRRAYLPPSSLTPSNTGHGRSSTSRS
ncbi:Adaptor protein Enigma and related PDZ-LIM proteins [Phaffia rhodozyma]|uniref:Adaptor protein Enigma and related PDZ-LIM proteins n=1 Tax=Phaffia rhodozyma TaxID=264483 RepID=A0A0F7SVD6_PHARH|nr:Adaptor protein Enigma and related PDZ-LIM proteins [Phaffia rhodozyma]